MPANRLPWLILPRELCPGHEPALLSLGFLLLGYGESVSTQHVRNWFGLDILHERCSFFFVPRVLDHDHALIERRIGLRRNLPVLSLPLHRWRDDMRHRYETDLRISRLDKLSRLRDVLPQDQPVRHLLIQADMFHRLDRRPAVRRMLRIRNRNSLYCRIQQDIHSSERDVDRRVSRSPHRQIADGITINAA